jgi:flagellar hook-basal body complex protein FliE
MNVDPIEGFLPARVSGLSVQGAVAPGDTLSKFGDWFGQQLAEVNGRLQRSDTDLQHLALGDAQNLHQVMINLEEAKLSFQLLVQVRNRALEAYQEVMRMQI